LETQEGDIILNVSFIPKDRFPESLQIIKEVCRAKLTVTDLVVIAEEGEEIGNSIVPENTVALGTVCAVTINGILLRHRVPVYSKFGGILQLEDAETPVRFTEVIYYDGTSLDPAEIFIKSRMTDVRNATKGGIGKVLAGFREFPAACLDVVEEVVNKLKHLGMEGVIAFGKPSQPLLEIPVSAGCVGMVVLAGLNPLAAVEEAGIETDNNALCSMVDFSKLRSLSEL
jgi:repressor of nif and glnA expression